MERKKLTFCSAAKVASTAITEYFYGIADGEVTIPANARYGAHQANWTYLKDVPVDLRRSLVTGEGIQSARGINRDDMQNSDEWIQVVFLRHAVERFVSGYLDKVVADCNKKFNPLHAIHFYDEFGFSCEKHQDFEEFITFMENVNKMEGHFEKQTVVCETSRYPWTKFVWIEDLDDFLPKLSEVLGKEYKPPSKRSKSHATGSSEKMLKLFQGRKYLLDRVLKIFDQDCKEMPKMCDVQNILPKII